MAEIALRSRLTLRLTLSAAQARAAALVGISVVALISRFWRIDHKSVWLDEGLSWRFARMSLPHMLDYTGAGDKHPPFYYATLHFWLRAFGDSETALRSISAIAGATSIVLIAVICWRIRGPLLAALVSAFLLLNSTQLYFSQEARMYAMMGTLAIAASIALAGVIEKPSIPRVALYTALLSAAVYTHYSAFVLAGVHAVLLAGYGGLQLWQQRRPYVLVSGAVAFIVTALLYIPWLSNFRQTARLGASDVPDPSRQLVLDAFKGALGMERAGDVWLLPALALVALGVYCVAKRWRDPMTVCIATIALVPVGQLLISVLSQPMFTLRQISPYLAGWVFLLGLGCVQALDLLSVANRAVRLTGTVAVVLIAGVLLGYMYRDFADQYDRPPLEDWRTAAADLRDFDGPIYVTASYTLAPFNYYFGSPANVQPFGLWSPENQPTGQITMIGVSHQSRNSVLAALGTGVSIEGERNYLGVTFFEVRTLHHAMLNVDVPVSQAGSGWTVNAQGYIESTSEVSSFTCNCVLDRDSDGRADEAFSIVVEYLDSAAGSFRVFGTSQDVAVVLAEERTGGTGQWRTLTATVPAGTPVSTTFGLSRGVVLRRLQLMRTQLENTDLLGSYQGTTRWLVQPDGYMQSADQYSYMNSTLQVDADKDGAIDAPFSFQLEYFRSPTPPEVYGLRPGDAWAPVLQNARVVASAGDWHTLQIDVAAGERLQPRFYIGKRVIVKAVRFLPAAR